MPRQLIRRKISSLRRNFNIRHDLGPEDDARVLWRSYKKQPVHPFFIKQDGSTVDGNRRHWGAELEGDLDHEVECLVVEGDLTPTEVGRIQFATAVHRSDISLYDKCLFVKAYRDENPGKTLKEIADDLDFDPTMPSKLSMFDKCIDAVKDQIKVGNIGLRDMIAIGAMPPKQQTEMLALKSSGASADEMGEQSRKHRQQRVEPVTDTVKSTSIKLSLVSGQTIIVKGRDLTLESASSLLTAAKQEIEKAKTQGLNTKTLEKVMLDRAKKAKQNAGQVAAAD